MWERRKVQAACLLAILALVYAWRHWNRPPAVDFDNLRYIQLLMTAVSARNNDWLERVEQAVAQRVQQGAMSVNEADHFRKVIHIARSGDWHTAHRSCYAFAEAQLSRRRARPAANAHVH